jgi:transposase
VIVCHQALIGLIRATKRVKRRRIRLREKRGSRLRLKPKLGYKLPAEALLIVVQVIVLLKWENNKNSQNNSDVRTITREEQ